jgi:hypothetical protein
VVSSGTKGFKGSRKSTPYAAQMAAEDAGMKARDHGMETVEVWSPVPVRAANRRCAPADRGLPRHRHPRRDADPAQWLPPPQAPARLNSTRRITQVLERNWQSLIKPEKLQVESGSADLRQATLVAEPLERGFGMTLGNACAASCCPRCRAPR